MAIQIESRLGGGSRGPRIQVRSSPHSASSFRLGGEAPVRLGGGAYLPEEDPADAKRFRRAVAAAIAFHLILAFGFWVLPTPLSEPQQISSNRSVYMVEPVRFQPPPKQAPRAKPVEKKKARRIPMPDPTPDDPEPIPREAPVEVPLIDAPEIGDLLDVPPAPPGAGKPGPMYIEGNVQPPKKVHAPQPHYTEEARKARVQGVVILQAIVDSLGNVTNVKVVKGLPEGLEESAVQTVSNWRYEPATLEGKPVSVYMNLTISFSLQ